MKKYIFFLLIFTILVSCSTKKDAFLNRTYQNFTSYYNTLFHGKEALKSQLKAKKKEHKDDFYGGYIEIFTQNALTNTSEDENLQNMASQFFGSNDNFQQQQSTTNSFQIAEGKALKIIENKSMVFRGIEKNKEIFNAYILLAESQIYQGKLFEALETLNQIYFTMPKDKRLPLAKIYEGLIYSKMKNYIRAEDIFLGLDKDHNLKKEYRKLLHVYYAENLIHSNRKEEAIGQLDLGMSFNKNREIKSRIAFLKGQILAELNKKEEARNSFTQAYKYANNFEFEVKSQIEIAKTFDKGDNYELAKKYIEKISKKGIYNSKKNEFYYALGLMANKAGEKEEAQNLFQKSIKEKISDNNIRGLVYFEIGKLYFEKENYIGAGAYYDSALAVMEYEPIKLTIAELSNNIKNISKNYYLIKKNDSILALTRMNENQKVAYFQKYIEELKEKETKQQEIEKANKNKRLTSTDFPIINPDFASFTSIFDDKKSNKFYFANQEAVAKGSIEFKKIWGNRALGDDWRFSANETNSIIDIENKALGRENKGDARRFEITYYTEKIPTDKEIILKLKKERDTASLGLGRMYEAYFQNTPLATKTLYDLVEQNPEEEIKLQALYLIFSMNFEKNATIAEKAKNLILQEFSHTPHAEFVKNPRRTNFTQTKDEVKQIYQKAYSLFSEEKFEESQKVISEAIEKFPKDALIPKFELLNAFITGKTIGKEVMLLQLQQLAFNYNKTAEGEKAQEIIDYLNNDIDTSTATKTANHTPQEKTTPNLSAEATKSHQQSPPKKGENKSTDKLQRPTYSWEIEYLKPTD